jgi:hypothetical protein
VLLDVQVAGVLPRVVLEAEQARLGTDLVHDLLHGLLLLGGASDGLAVGVAGAGPTDLGNELALGGGLGAHLGGLLELLGGEVAGHLGGDRGGEVRVDLYGEDVDVVAQSGALLLPGADGLGGGDGDVLGEAGALKSLTDVVDVGSELGGSAVVVEHALVADDDHGDAVLGGVALDVVELVVGVLGEGTLATAAAGLEEDTVDDLQTVFLAGGNDVLEDTAVSAVRADGGETKIGNLLDIRLDVGLGLAVATGGIGSVGHSPLVAVGDNATAGAVASSRLGLVGRLGAAGLGLRGVRRLGGVLRRSRLRWLRNLLGRVLGNSRLGDLRHSRLGNLRHGRVLRDCRLGDLRHSRLRNLRYDRSSRVGGLGWRRCLGGDHNGSVDGASLLGARGRAGGLYRRSSCRIDGSGVGHNRGHYRMLVSGILKQITYLLRSQAFRLSAGSNTY